MLDGTSARGYDCTSLNGHAQLYNSIQVVSVRSNIIEKNFDTAKARKQVSVISRQWQIQTDDDKLYAQRSDHQD